MASYGAYLVNKTFFSSRHSDQNCRSLERCYLVFLFKIIQGTWSPLQLSIEISKLTPQLSVHVSVVRQAPRIRSQFLATSATKTFSFACDCCRIRRSFTDQENLVSLSPLITIFFLSRDEICRQEFQYAKKTARKPVIPVVVGSGSFEWMMTVVGLLIAGEVYIHFSNRDVQDSKMTELLRAVKKSVPEVKFPEELGSVQGMFCIFAVTYKDSTNRLQSYSHLVQRNKTVLPHSSFLLNSDMQGVHPQNFKLEQPCTA